MSPATHTSQNPPATTRRSTSALFLGLAACLLSGAAQAQNAGPPIPMPATARPSLILVADATASPGNVQLDTSPGMQAQRTATGVTPEQAATQDVRAVQAALSNTLVQKIQAMGLNAMRVPAGTLPAPGELAVTVQITAIDEGNRTRRTLIGLGAGQVSVQGIATLLQGSNNGPQVLQTYANSANSGRMPGLGIGAAAAGVKSATTAVSGAAHGASELDSPVAAEAAKLAGRLATKLGQYFAVQNWIAPSAVPGATL